jgi:hypothetical protein
MVYIRFISAVCVVVGLFVVRAGYIGCLGLVGSFVGVELSTNAVGGHLQNPRSTLP